MRNLTASAFAAAFLLAAQMQSAAAQTSDLVVRSELRVCADPANMPFSNQKQEGFENKIAEVIGKALEIPVTYYWFPQSTGFIRRTLRDKRCDVVIGYAQGHELVQNTNHYYSSAYVLVTRADSDLADVEDLSDPKLKGKKIGVIAGTPPATNLAVNGLMGSVRPFHLNVDRRFIRQLKTWSSKSPARSSMPGFSGGYRRVLRQAKHGKAESDAAPERKRRAAEWFTGSRWASVRRSRIGNASLTG